VSGSIEVSGVRSRTFWGLRLGWLGGVLLLACGAPSVEPVGETTEAVDQGTVVAPWVTNSPDWMARPAVYAGCSGTIVQPSWVLTARHCLLNVGQAVHNINRSDASLTESRVVDAVLMHPDPDIDVSMLHVDNPFTRATPAPLYSGTTASLYGQTLRCYGYGAYAWTNCSSGVCYSFDPDTSPQDHKLRRALLTAQALQIRGLNTPDIFTIPENSSGQNLMPGDSGGPCFNSSGALVGFDSFGSVTVANEGSISAALDWSNAPSRTEFTTGDFSGDGKQDFIKTTTSGSTFYTFTAETGNHTITATAGTENTTWKLGRVHFTVGKFNAGARADYIVTEPGGSHFYTSNFNGTFSETYTRTDWPLWGAYFYPGDFDGDGITDLIVQTPWWAADGGAAYFYYYKNGGWFEAMRRSDWPSGIARFTIGNWDGDSETDFVVQTPQGSYWYYGENTPGIFTQSYTRTDLPRQMAEYIPGDLDGDTRTDLIILTPSGTYFYYANSARGSWTEGARRLDLTFGNVSYQTGNFDGNGGDDILIYNASGSYWYYATGTRGVWNVLGPRSDLIKNQVQYTLADFTGEGKKDMLITVPSGSYFYYGTSSTAFGNWNTSWTQGGWKM
jgi:hypothetical protein